MPKPIRLFVFVAALLVALPVAVSAAENPQEPQKVFLWEVRSETATVYLLGTIHVATDELYPLDPTIDDAYKSSDILVMELALTPETLIQTLFSMMQTGMYQGPQTIADHVSAETFAKIKAPIRESGFPPALLYKMRPWLLNVMLQLAEIQRLGYDTTKGIDMHFHARALKQQKPVYQLETIEEQMNALATGTEEMHERALVEAVDSLPETDDFIEKTFKAWADGDTAALSKAVEGALPEDPYLKPWIEALFDNRNVKMAAKIEEYLATDKTYFVMVGSGHIIGEKGILAILQDKQYAAAQLEKAPRAPYPPSEVITGVSFDASTMKTLAPGSDNWAVTWADDDHQYTTWGDGGGFGGTNDDGRVSLGFGRVEGSKDDYRGFNVWGGKNPVSPAAFPGKSYGIISINGVLYAWRSGAASECFDLEELYKSTDHGATWEFTGVRFTPENFPRSKGFFCTTFLQFGRDYQGAIDGYVYMYAPEAKDTSNWNVQHPGEITLLRVPKEKLTSQASYEFFAGTDSTGAPTWTTDVSMRKAVFSDAPNGVMRTSVIYNSGLDRCILITQQVDRFQKGNGHIGIYDAPAPWGPWTTVLFKNAWKTPLHTASKTVYWNFSSKWMSPDGRDFVLVYTGDSEKRGSDNWNTIEGRFETAPSAPEPAAVTPAASQ